MSCRTRRGQDAKHNKAFKRRNQAPRGWWRGRVVTVKRRR